MTRTMARRKISDTPGSPPPSFEESLARLEAIVEAMENRQLPLEELVDHYEKGSSLLDHCEAVLKSARGRIELVTLRDRTAPADEAATPSDSTAPSPSADADDSDSDDDIRLF